MRRAALLLACAALLGTGMVWVLASRLVWLPHILYLTPEVFSRIPAARWRATWPTLAGMAWPGLIAPLGVLGAGLYGALGLSATLPFVVALLIVGGMASSRIARMQKIASTAPDAPIMCPVMLLVDEIGTW